MKFQRDAGCWVLTLWKIELRWQKDWLPIESEWGPPEISITTNPNGNSGRTLRFLPRSFRFCVTRHRRYDPAVDSTWLRGKTE